MIRILGIVSLLLTLLEAGGQPSVALQQFLQTAGLKNAAIGVAVKKVSDGSEVVTYHSGTALTPASVTKIIPTWFALQQKGETYRYNTSVYYTGSVIGDRLCGDIILSAGGDPTPDSRYFPANSLVLSLIDAIQKAGIRRIQGNILVEGAKAGTEIPGSWPWEDIANYYAALYLPFNYRDNTYTMHFRTGQPDRPAELVSVIPVIPGMKIRNEVKASRVNKDNAWIFGGPYSTEMCVKGTLPANRPDFKVKGAMFNPAVVFIHEVVDALAKKNITVEQQGLEYAERTLLLKYSSPSVEEIVFHTNKASVNLFAEALGNLAGEGDWAANVKTLLIGEGIDASGIILKDACGLSPMNAVPAGVFTDLLVLIGRQQKLAFLNSLPVGGVDGGLGGYCSSFPKLKQNLRAKTGSMSDVRCLAGFLTRSDGEQLAFTILINHYTCSPAQIQQAVGKFLNHLVS